MPRLAIQEDLLPGKTLSERLAAARQLNIEAVELPAEQLDQRLPEIAAALDAHGMLCSGINMGCGISDGYGCLSADAQRRAQAADDLREALTCALDLEAHYVSFAPQRGKSDLPDLSPFATALDLQKELLVWLLRGISDLCDAMDVRLALQPLNRYETAFIKRLDQAGYFLRQVDNHAKISIAAQLFHLALEEADLLAALRAHMRDISVIYLCDNNGRLPGQGHLPFEALGAALSEGAYAGWLVLAGAQTQTLDKPMRAPHSIQDLSACLQFLRRAGFI